jgi:hypothetical protein
MKHRGDWMQTATGRQFWPLDPRPDDVFIEDIAHALSLLCRFGGHCLRFYSVAEHSVLLARAAPARLKKWALLHDAAEAYIVDVPRPLKPFLTNYKQAEAAVMRAIEFRFGLHLGLPDQVKQLDRAILVDEMQQNMAPSVAAWTSLDGLEPIGVKLQFWTPRQARIEFMREFRNLPRAS